MLQSYLVRNEDSNIPFAVISDIDKTNLTHSNKELVQKVSQAVAEEFITEEDMTVRPNSIIKTVRKGITEIELIVQDEYGNYEYPVILIETTIY